MPSAPLSRRSLLLAGSAGLAATLAACASATPPARFPRLDYSYLPPIRLNVAHITIRDSYRPVQDGFTLDADAPELPARLLARMARERLSAMGSTGEAVFVIRAASLRRAGGNIVGTLSVRLDVRTPDGSRVGFASAAVQRSRSFPKGDQNELRRVLYDMEKRLMAAMNVEFEYQLRRSLGEWLVGANGGAPPPPPVQAKPLAPPPAPKLVPLSPPGQ